MTTDNSESDCDEVPWVENNPNLIPTRVNVASDTDVAVDVNNTDSSMGSKDYEEGNGNDSTTEEYCSSDGNVDINGEDSNESYKNKCLQELKSEELLHNLIDKLEQSKHLRDFMMLIKHLAYGTIPMDNIVFLLMLERARFQSCSTMIAMRYCKVTKLFWSIVYRLCKSAGLKFFSGEKNWGQVVSKQCERSHYNPDKSKINFAVPSEHVLRRIEGKLPKIIPPGKIYQCMDLLTNEKDIILMADGKLVTKGLKENFCGDVNLFGHETDPNISELEDEINRHLEFVSKCIVHFKTSDEVEKYELIQDLTNCISVIIGKIRKFVSCEQKKLRTYTKSVFSEQKLPESDKHL